MGTVPSGGFELLLLGGRAGVGKTSVAAEVSLLLREAGVPHCHIEGDVLDAAHPKPAEDPDGALMTERNLRSLVEEYRRLGYTRLVYVNTVSVIEPDLVRRAVGDVDSVVSVLLEADDAAVSERLSARERGSELPRYLARGSAVARALAQEAGPQVHRLDVSRSSVREAAAQVVDLTGWVRARAADVDPPRAAGRARPPSPLPAGVVVSPVGRDDAAAVADFLTTSDWPFHAGGRRTRHEILDQVRSGYLDADGVATFAVGDGGRTTGLVRLQDLDDDTAVFDLRVADGERARGLGTTLVRWVTDHVFSTHPSVIRVEATTRHDNVAMRKVLHRCGYVLESRYRASWPDARGDLVDAVGYAMIRRDWARPTERLDPPVDPGTSQDAPAGPATTSTSSQDERELLLDFCLVAFDELTALVAAMDDGSANWRPDRPGANSVLALLVHCCGAARRWSSTVNLGVDVPRDRDAEFTTRVPVADAVRLASSTRAALVRDVRTTDLDAAPVAVPDGGADSWTATCRGVLLHVLVELSQHLGQAEITRDERAAR